MRTYKLIVYLEKLSHPIDIEASSNPQVKRNLDSPILSNLKVFESTFLLESLILDNLLSVSKHRSIFFKNV